MKKMFARKCDPNKLSFACFAWGGFFFIGPCQWASCKGALFNVWYPRREKDDTLFPQRVVAMKKGMYDDGTWQSGVECKKQEKGLRWKI